MAGNLQQQLGVHLDRIKDLVKASLFESGQELPSEHECYDLAEMQWKQRCEQLQQLMDQLEDSTALEIIHGREDQTQLIRLVTMNETTVLTVECKRPYHSSTR